MGLIIAVYSLVFVFFKNNFNFRNLFSANAALSTFVIVIPISFDHFLFIPYQIRIPKSELGR